MPITDALKRHRYCITVPVVQLKLLENSKSIHFGSLEFQKGTKKQGMMSPNKEGFYFPFLSALVCCKFRQRSMCSHRAIQHYNPWSTS